MQELRNEANKRIVLVNGRKRTSFGILKKLKGMPSLTKQFPSFVYNGALKRGQFLLANKHTQILWSAGTTMVSDFEILSRIGLSRGMLASGLK